MCKGNSKYFMSGKASKISEVLQLLQNWLKSMMFYNIYMTDYNTAHVIWCFTIWILVLPLR